MINPKASEFQFSDFFTSPKSVAARMSLNYLDDNITPIAEGVLDEQRTDWRERKMTVQYRNILKSIVGESSGLYRNGMPSIELQTGGNIDDAQTELYLSLLTKVRFHEFMLSFDNLVRATRTAHVLVAYNEGNQTIYFQSLYRGNAFLEVDPITSEPIQLIINTHDDEYRIVTNLFFEDWVQEAGSNPKLISQVVNPYGFIPITTFYDTLLPRSGAYASAPQDLVTMNNSLNLFLSDIVFAAGYSVHKSLIITNAEPDPATTSLQAGLGTTLYLDGNGSDPATMQFLGPDIDLLQSQTMFFNLVKDVARDWAVNIRTESATQPASGFSLIVQEKSGLELTSIRQHLQSIALADLYKVYALVFNVHAGNGQQFTSERAKVEFNTPDLPFDEKVNEDIWKSRIEDGRASVIDYLEQKHNISREDAIILQQRIAQDQEDSELLDNDDESLDTP